MAYQSDGDWQPKQPTNEEIEQAKLRLQEMAAENPTMFFNPAGETRSPRRDREIFACGVGVGLMLATVLLMLTRVGT